MDCFTPGMTRNRHIVFLLNSLCSLALLTGPQSADAKRTRSAKKSKTASTLKTKTAKHSTRNLRPASKSKPTQKLIDKRRTVQVSRPLASQLVLRRLNSMWGKQKWMITLGKTGADGRISFFARSPKELGIIRMGTVATKSKSPLDQRVNVEYRGPLPNVGQQSMSDALAIELIHHKLDSKWGIGGPQGWRVQLDAPSKAGVRKFAAWSAQGTLIRTGSIKTKGNGPLESRVSVVQY
jgi:hypothetical protein